jgi:hypothetical protein
MIYTYTATDTLLNTDFRFVCLKRKGIHLAFFNTLAAGSANIRIYSGFVIA